MRAVLTELGKTKVRLYLAELKAKRKEILDARKDTASFPLPIMSDVVMDMNEVLGPADDYYDNKLVCTDHYEADTWLELRLGTDFYWDKGKEYMVRLYYEHDDPEHNRRKGDIKGEFFFDSLEDAQSLYRGIFEYPLLSYNPTVWRYDYSEEEYIRLEGY